MQPDGRYFITKQQFLTLWEKLCGWELCSQQGCGDEFGARPRQVINVECNWMEGCLFRLKNKKKKKRGENASSKEIQSEFSDMVEDA